MLLAIGWWASGAQGCPASKLNRSLLMGLLFGNKALLQRKICMLKSTGVIINSVPAERLSPRGQFRQKHTVSKTSWPLACWKQREKPA